MTKIHCPFGDRLGIVRDSSCIGGWTGRVGVVACPVGLIVLTIVLVLQ